MEGIRCQSTRRCRNTCSLLTVSNDTALSGTGACDGGHPGATSTPRSAALAVAHVNTVTYVHAVRRPRRRAPHSLRAGTIRPRPRCCCWCKSAGLDAPAWASWRRGCSRRHGSVKPRRTARGARRAHAPERDPEAPRRQCVQPVRGGPRRAVRTVAAGVPVDNVRLRLSRSILLLNCSAAADALRRAPLPCLRVSSSRFAFILASRKSDHLRGSRGHFLRSRQRMSAVWTPSPSRWALEHRPRTAQRPARALPSAWQ